MKIQCDVCNKGDASIFCTADEAAICDTCDHRVHHANKLASKHQRFSLIHPLSKHFPVCDICQERRAFLFCQQDRAILCRECDFSIHTANGHTQEHNRFLLTGIKLSAASAVYKSSSPDTIPSAIKPQPLVEISVVSTVSPANSNTPSVAKRTSTSTTNSNSNSNKCGGVLVANDGGGCGSTSSISEYLIETLPGWHVEDFLDFSSGLCKADDEMSPFFDAELDHNLSPLSSEDMGVWVPHLHHDQYSQMGGGLIGFKETKEGTIANMKANNRMWMDYGFTVPQISPPSVGSKRSTPF